ncbi:hypothetical protein MKP07_20505 [Niabella hibiscisoli]|nr:hypothetical protein [Niabella hibiscisoli]MCH5718406.1 hypothetical protein [Niabella hibiscisoli]
MDFEQLNQFSDQHTTPEDALLSEVSSFTLQNHAEPHMLSGHVQGQLLKMVSQMIRPERILEIGTFTGYSALCLAAGLQPDGILHTIEFREPTAAIAQNFFKNRLIRTTYNCIQVMHWKSYRY